MVVTPESWKIPWHLVLIFSLLSGGILLLGYLYYDYQVAFFQKAKEEELGTIADLKAREIAAWRQERRHDAMLMFDDPIFADEVSDWFNGKNPPEQFDKIRHRLEALKQDFYIGISLFDTEGRVRVAIPEIKPELLPIVRNAAQEATGAGRVVFTDLYLVPGSQEINISLALPFHIHQGNKEQIVGAILLQIDPHHYLYPILESWPTPSKTAELVMARRENASEIVYLNELRHHKGAPLRLRKPMTEKQLPAVRAALGEERVFRGIDYRGVEVLAATRTILDTPWFLTAKIDMCEVTAPFRRWWYLIPISTVALMAAAGLGVGLIWRHRDAQFYRRQYRLESERLAFSQRYEYLAKYANDIMLVMDREGKIVEANDLAVASYGYERPELFNLHLGDLFVDGGRSWEEKKELEMEEKNGLRFEAVNRRKDGTTFPVEISSSLMEIGGSRLYQYIIRDISERKRREKALRESEEQLRFLSSQLLIVQEKERHRISKELHDELGQALIVLKFQIDSIEQRLPKTKKALKNDCQALYLYIDNIVDKVRRLSRDLTPSALEQFGLAAALGSLLEEFGKHYEVQWAPERLEEINDLFSTLSRINIYRIFQEALTNIAKHGQATKIAINIHRQGRHVTLAIEDNGRGFDPREIRAMESGEKGIGLSTMQERARIAGGCLKIWSRPGAGTKLTIAIPMEQGAQNDDALSHYAG
ncbi:MAG: PAS domain-containing sensor histidine kinase [Deltaproteobacteria bacterium]|nr:MAG: PAS domain-containing sensor histidine kinase [Deltaproteobacteria bacterium]